MPTELERIADEAATCTRCRLHESRTQVVSGQLLNRLLAGIGLRREDVYICNVVKSRPPRNRDPQPDEIAACRPWLDAQIRLVDPKVVVTLGNFAAKTLLETTTGISRLRGQTYPFQGRVLLPTFHPAAALHAEGRRFAGPSPREAMEEDFRTLAKLLTERTGTGVSADPPTREEPAPRAASDSDPAPEDEP